MRSSRPISPPHIRAIPNTGLTPPPSNSLQLNHNSRLLIWKLWSTQQPLRTQTHRLLVCTKHALAHAHTGKHAHTCTHPRILSSETPLHTSPIRERPGVPRRPRSSCHHHSGIQPPRLRHHRCRVLRALQIGNGSGGSGCAGAACPAGQARQATTACEGCHMLGRGAGDWELGRVMARFGWEVLQERNGMSRRGNAEPAGAHAHTLSQSQVPPIFMFRAFSLSYHYIYSLHRWSRRKASSSADQQGVCASASACACVSASGEHVCAS